jgi:hypothetical protein
MASEDVERFASTSSYDAKRATFLTQSGALARKNLRYQQKNWHAAGSSFRCAAPTADAHCAWQAHQLLPGAHAARVHHRAGRFVLRL